MNEETLDHEMDNSPVQPFHMHEKKEFQSTPPDMWEEWTKGVVTMTCHNCGHVQPLGDEQDNGIQIMLPMTNYHSVRLVCSQCNSAMELHFVKGENAEIVENEEEVIDQSKLDNQPEDAKVVEEPGDELKEESTEA